VDWAYGAAPDPAVVAGAWQNIELLDWTAEGWQAFLESLTPRQLVFQMRAWCLLALDAPELRPELEQACDEVRAVIWRRECVPNVPI